MTSELPWMSAEALPGLAKLDQGEYATCLGRVAFAEKWPLQAVPRPRALVRRYRIRPTYNRSMDSWRDAG